MSTPNQILDICFEIQGFKMITLTFQRSMFCRKLTCWGDFQPWWRSVLPDCFLVQSMRLKSHFRIAFPSHFLIPVRGLYHFLCRYSAPLITASVNTRVDRFQLRSRWSAAATVTSGDASPLSEDLLKTVHFVEHQINVDHICLNRHHQLERKSIGAEPPGPPCLNIGPPRGGGDEINDHTRGRCMIQLHLGSSEHSSWSLACAQEQQTLPLARKSHPNTAMEGEKNPEAQAQLSHNLHHPSPPSQHCPFCRPTETLNGRGWFLINSF